MWKLIDGISLSVSATNKMIHFFHSVSSLLLTFLNRGSILKLMVIVVTVKLSNCVKGKKVKVGFLYSATYMANQNSALHNLGSGS